MYTNFQLPKGVENPEKSKIQKLLSNIFRAPQYPKLTKIAKPKLALVDL